MTDAQKADRAQTRLAESASKLKESAAQQTDSADRRTGLAALAAGVGAKALLKDVVEPWLGSATASLLILFSTFCFVAGVWRELDPGAPPPRTDIHRLPSWQN